MPLLDTVGRTDDVRLVDVEEIAQMAQSAAQTEYTNLYLVHSYHFRSPHIAIVWAALLVDVTGWLAIPCDASHR